MRWDVKYLLHHTSMNIPINGYEVQVTDCPSERLLLNQTLYVKVLGGFVSIPARQKRNIAQQRCRQHLSQCVYIFFMTRHPGTGLIGDPARNLQTVATNSLRRKQCVVDAP